MIATPRRAHENDSGRTSPLEEKKGPCFTNNTLLAPTPCVLVAEAAPVQEYFLGKAHRAVSPFARGAVESPMSTSMRYVDLPRQRSFECADGHIVSLEWALFGFVCVRSARLASAMRPGAPFCFARVRGPYKSHNHYINAAPGGSRLAWAFLLAPATCWFPASRAG